MPFDVQVPEHWCLVPELAHLSPEDRRNLSVPLEERDRMLAYSRCLQYDINFTAVIPYLFGFVDGTGQCN